MPLSIFRAGRFESVYSDQANLGFDKEIAGALLVNVDYLHVRGRKILIERNINPVVAELGRRPDPDFSETFLYESTGRSWYDTVTAGLRSRPGGPLEIAACYSYSVAEDDAIDWSEGQPQDPLNVGAERGPTLHVPRHKAVFSAVYATAGRPGPSWERDWTLAMIADFLAGLPYNELAGFDRNGNGDPLSDRPAHVGRNSRSLPASFDVDFRIARQIRVRRAAIEGIVEVFNLFNRKNVLDVNNVRFASAELDRNPDFGKPIRTSDPRRIQLGARLTF